MADSRVHFMNTQMLLFPKNSWSETLSPIIAFGINW